MSSVLAEREILGDEKAFYIQLGFWDSYRA
jgi:hypothetical protein